MALAASSARADGGGADLEIEQYVKAESSGRANGVARKFSALGNATTGAVLIGTGYLIGRWSHSDRLAEASSLSAEALLSAGIYSTALKALTARTRPAGGARGDFFEYTPEAGQVAGSFPSGHATGAFAVATVFAGVYSDDRWVPWVMYGTAGFIGASRVALGRHFPSDVLVGALLGHSIGRMVLSRQTESWKAASRIEPFFDLNGEAAGLMWTRRW